MEGDDQRKENTVRPHGSGHRGETASGWADDPAITTFTLRIPRWAVLTRLRGRDPLVRKVDRIEALIFALAVVAAVLAVPLVGAIGTEVHDARSHHNAELAAGRAEVPATITNIAADPGDVIANTATVTGRWSLDGTEHTGVVPAPPTAEVGDTIQIWVDDTGAWVPAPPPPSGAAADAVTVAILTLFAVAGAAVTVIVLTRKCCDRIRLARWQHGLEELVDHGDGHPRPSRS
jgi:hypothetical protein